MNQAVLQGSVTSHSWQPDIVGVRNQNKRYFAWRLDGSPDSLRFIGTNRNGIWAQNVAMMNSQSVLSGLQGPKPGFRYATDDSCFVIYAPTGPYDIWAAYGCSGPISVVDNDLPRLIIHYHRISRTHLIHQLRYGSAFLNKDWLLLKYSIF